MKGPIWGDPSELIGDVPAVDGVQYHHLHTPPLAHFAPDFPRPRQPSNASPAITVTTPAAKLARSAPVAAFSGLFIAALKLSASAKHISTSMKLPCSPMSEIGRASCR